MTKETRFTVPGWTKADLTAGKASRVIRHIDELSPGTHLIIVTCVSSRDRARDRVNNHRDQRLNLTAEARERGLRPVGVLPYTGSRFDPTWVATAVAKARKRGADVILFESTDRIVRHRQFRTDHPKFVNLQATEEQLRELAQHAEGVTLVTDSPPDATPAQVRSYQRKRGQQFKDRRGGRPVKPGYKKRRKEKKLGDVLALWKKGIPHRTISAVTGVPDRTVGRWINGA